MGSNNILINLAFPIFDLQVIKPFVCVHTHTQSDLRMDSGAMQSLISIFARIT